MKLKEIKECIEEYAIDPQVSDICKSMINMKPDDYEFKKLNICDKEITKKSDLEHLLKKSGAPYIEILSVYNVAKNVMDTEEKYEEELAKVKKESDDIKASVTSEIERLKTDASYAFDDTKEEVKTSYEKTEKRASIFLVIGIILFIALIPFVVIYAVNQIMGTNEVWPVTVMSIVGALGSVADVAGIFNTLREIRDDKEKNCGQLENLERGYISRIGSIYYNPIQHNESGSSGQIGDVYNNTSK